jgi:hypothetical protein
LFGLTSLNLHVKLYISSFPQPQASPPSSDRISPGQGNSEITLLQHRSAMQRALQYFTWLERARYALLPACATLVFTLRAQHWRYS